MPSWISDSRLRAAALAVAQTWASRHPGVRVAVCAADGKHCAGSEPAMVPANLRASSIASCFAIGEGVVVGGDGAFAWAAPLTANASLLGGVLAWIPESLLFPHGARRASLDVRAACRSLIEACCAADLCNRALLDSRLADHRLEQERAGLLHRLKRDGGGGVAASYLAVESELVAALRQGDRAAARTQVNRVLVVALHQAGGDVGRARGLLLELVVLLRHTALAAGGAAHLMPGGEALLAGLDAAHDDAAVARWLRQALEALFDCLQLPRGDGDAAAAARLLRCIAERCHEELGRDTLAAELGVAPARLSRLVRHATGVGLPEAIARARVDRARVLLERGETVLDTALAVGFSDPSNFARIFRRHTGVPPSVWRERLAGHSSPTRPHRVNR